MVSLTFTLALPLALTLTLAVPLALTLTLAVPLALTLTLALRRRRARTRTSCTRTCSSAACRLYLPYIPATSPPYLLYISPISRLRTCSSAAHRLYLPYISSISPLYLPYISPTDLLFRGAQAELFTVLVSALSVLGAPPAA